jgi:hypothetical protein
MNKRTIIYGGALIVFVLIVVFFYSSVSFSKIESYIATIGTTTPFVPFATI